MMMMIVMMMMMVLVVTGENSTIATSIAKVGAEVIPLAETSSSASSASSSSAIPVKEPTAAPSAEGTESTAPSIPDEEEGGFTPITDIQGSQTPTIAPTSASTKVTKVVTKDEGGNKEVITTITTKDQEGNIEITEQDVEVEKSSSFVRLLIFTFIATALGLFCCRKRILKYFEKRNPYGSYSQVSVNER